MKPSVTLNSSYASWKNMILMQREVFKFVELLKGILLERILYHEKKKACVQLPCYKFLKAVEKTSASTSHH
jgi:hypothetical protein